MELLEVERESRPALTVRSAHKWFGSHEVLQGLDVNVPQGCIYALLGPSGCGKTTLFKCIVGREILDAGEIVLARNAKEDVGYMPQDTCLYEEFTIEENCFYYANLYGLSNDDKVKRSRNLAELLGIPFFDHRVKKLSGGQKRRVSLLIALLHNPSLLILDEPTVGLDPLLSHNIWKYLLNMTSNERKTVVLTTHYVEEARQAHKIGMMREGILLAEEGPAILLETQQTDSLEHVFLNLCQSHAVDRLDGKTQVSSVLPINQIPGSPLIGSSKIRLSKVKAQNMKSLYWMKGNLSIGPKPKNLHVAYVNEEMNMTQCQGVPSSGCLAESYLSCRYLDTLSNKGIILDRYNTVEEGKAAVGRKGVWGVMHFSSNYSASLIDRLAQFPVATEDLEFSQINIWMDMSGHIMANSVIKDIRLSIIQILISMFEDCGWPPSASNIPLRFEKPVFGSNDPSFTDFTLPGFIIVGIFSTTTIFTYSTLLDEKTSGILDRNIVAGLNVLELLLSHVTVQMSLLVIQTLGTLAINYTVFDHAMTGSWTLLLALVVCVGWQGACYGILTATLCNSEVEATALSVGTLFGLILISGCAWPLQGMHPMLQSISHIFPLTPSIDAFRAIGYKAWTIFHPKVYLGFVSCAVWSVIFLVVAAISYNCKFKYVPQKSK